jgi:hypothetical protein
MPSAFTRVANGDLQLEFKGGVGYPELDPRCVITRKGDPYYNEASTVVGLNLWAIKAIHDWYERNKPPFPGPGSTDALQLRLMEQRLKAVEEKTTAYSGGGTYGAWLSKHEDRITILEERLDNS